MLRSVETHKEELSMAFKQKELRVVIYTCEPESVALEDMLTLAKVRVRIP